MKQSMRGQIDELERSLKMEQDYIDKLKTENDQLKARMTIIAGENESLRMDKKWLQQMHSAVLQTMMSRKDV